MAQQVEQGAPVDLFAAADVLRIDALEAKGLILPDTRKVYALGRIALWTRADSPLRLERLEDLLRPEVQRIAIANPDHAPYGVAARQAMQSAGIWEKLQDRLVLAENAQQTLQYAQTGNVDAAIVPLYHEVEYHLVSKRVHGLRFTLMGLLGVEGVTAEEGR